MSTETDVFPGAAEDVSNDDGMSIEDAASSSYDDHERATDGIAEGERENLGKYLKSHADAVWTTVIDGLNSLLEPAVALHTGDMTAKSKVIGDLIDAHNIHPLPEAEPAPVDTEYGQPALGDEGQTIATEEQAVAVIEQFAQANPIMRDERIQDHMRFIAHDMRRQGFQPTLEACFHHAVNSDPRYSPQARQAQEAQHIEQAKQASVQISGGANMTPNSVSDDLDDIIREQLGR